MESERLDQCKRCDKILFVKFKMKAKGFLSSYCPVFFNMITTKKTWC